MASQSPNAREGISAVSSITGTNEYVYSTDHALDVNVAGELQPVEDFDYLGITATSSTVDTLEYKLGGSGGTTVRTVVVTYTGAGVEKISTTFNNISYS